VGRAESPSATLSVMNKRRGRHRRISCMALPRRAMDLRTGGTAWGADDEPLEVACEVRCSKGRQRQSRGAGRG
jgi:hypothetical protein